MRYVSLCVTLIASASLTACAVATTCNIPSLKSGIPSKTTRHVGGPFGPRCSESIASKQRFPRGYGTIRMRWWGSQHRLYIVGWANDGTPLTFRGARVEEYSAKRWYSPTAKYSHRITFPVYEYAGNPSSETFALEVLGKDLQLIERLEMTYAPKQCTCRDYDSL
jgi:hypothetical protein